MPLGGEFRQALESCEVENSILPLTDPFDSSQLAQSTKRPDDDLADGSEFFSKSCLRHSEGKHGIPFSCRSRLCGRNCRPVALQNELSESRLDAVDCEAIHPLDQGFDSVRKTLQEKERESRVCRNRSLDRGLGEKQASRWLGGYRCRRIATAGEERYFSQRGTGLTGVDYELATAAATDDADFSLQHQSNAFRAIACRPENLTGGELFLHGLFEQCVPPRWTEGIEKLISCVDLTQCVKTDGGCRRASEVWR
jgi:hypothetical protein